MARPALAGAATSFCLHFIVLCAPRNDMVYDVAFFLNEALAMRPGQHLTRTLTYADTAVVDGAVMGVAKATVATGSSWRKLQNGYVRSYAALILAGVVIAGIVLHFVRL